MKKILFFDSGSGGLNILAHCLNGHLGGDILYYADTFHAPYGNKTERELCENAAKVLKHISTFFAYEIVVLACNTLTTSAISCLRNQFPNVTFVGTVPAIKPALNKYKKEDILLMATDRTLQNLNWTDGLCVKDLPKLIDDNLLSLENLQELLEKNLLPYHNKKAVVLGCTHYYAVETLLKQILPNAEFFSSKEGVLKRLKTYVHEKDCEVQFMESGEQKIALFSNYCQSLINFL